VAARGFTLVELLVALALLAILATLAAPALGEYLKNCRRAATVNALAHAVHAARTLSAAQGRAVRLCPSTNAFACTGGRDWSGPLLIEPEAPEDPTSDAGPSRVVQIAADGSLQSVRSNREFIRFAPLAVAATTATLTICDDRGAPAARAVIISRVGRPRVSSRDASGRPLECQ
jgi:type IV fimbrial biogenesis protein FimT